MQTDSEILNKKKQELLKLRATMTSVILETARHVGELAQVVDAKKVRAFLRTECGLPSRELSTYLRFSEKLGADMKALENKNVSFPLARALVAADEHARREAVALIESGSTLDAHDVARISRRIHDSRFEAQDIELSKRRRQVGKLAGENLKRLKTELDEGIYDLLAEVEEFLADHIPHPFDEWHADPEDPTYGSAIEKIRDSATSLLSDFKVVYGAHHVPVSEFDRADRTDPNVVVAKAWHALNRFAEGAFGIDVGFAFDPNINATWPEDIFSALTELLADSKLEPSAPVRPRTVIRFPSSHERTLKSVELCAGAGGLALGLQAAGFESIGLFEKDKDAAETLRRNQPSWPVFEQSIKRDFHEFSGRVDLLAGGMPCQPFSSQGNRKGDADEIDLFRDGVRIVQQIMPRAFVFENVTGFNAPNFSSYRAELLHGFETAGYDVEAIILNARHFGVPQSRDRVFIVGMARNELNRFRRPPMLTSARSFIGDALADLMASEGWSGAEQWSLTYGQSVSPTVVCHSSSAFATATKTWAKSGINPRGIARTGPTDQEAAAAGDGFLPKMTNRMRARLQAFADDWEFAGSKTAQARQIGNAVPPPLGMIIGLSVRAALEGVDVDYESVLTHPLIADGLIGKPAPVRKRINLNAMAPKIDFGMEEEGEAVAA